MTRIGHTGRVRLAHCLVVAALVWLGRADAANPVPAPAPRVMRVSRSELFTGDLKRLEPHLGLTSSGCIKIDFEGPEIWFGTEEEVWQDGKLLQGLSKSNSRLEGPKEVSFSLKQITYDDKPKHRMVSAVSAKSRGGSSAFTGVLPGTPGNSSGVAELDAPIELEPGKSIAVFAFVEDEHKPGQEYSLGGTFDEKIKRAKRAIVFKISWKETKD